MVPIPEQLLLSLTGLAALAWVFSRVFYHRLLLPGVLAVALLICIVLTGVRPVLWPLVLVALVLLLLTAKGGAGDIQRRWLRLLAQFGTVLIVVTALVIPVVFYIPALPEPSGSYAVGHRVVHWVDTSREETYTEDESDRRELPVHIWYPAQVPADAETEPYMSEDSARALVSHMFPQMPFLAANLSRASTYHYRDVPVFQTQERFPVLVFSHGYSWNIEMHQILMEAAAGNGYIVFAIDHTYDASTTVLKGGSRANFVDAVRPEPPSAEVQAELEAFLQQVQFPDASLTDGQKEQLWVDLFDMHPLVQQGTFERWVEDKRFVVDRLFELRTGGGAELADIAQMLDLDQLGIYGMSGGGAAAGMFCFQDTRCRAGVNLDGTQFGQISPNGVFLQPFMFVLADQQMAGNPSDNRTLIFQRLTEPAYHLEIAGTTHGSFGDFPFWSMLFERSVSSGKAARLNRYINDFTLAFFDRYLKGESGNLLSSETASKMPELSLQIRN